MSTDPAFHQRRSIRLKGYDYAQAGAYFITICTHNRLPLFGKIVRAGFIPDPNNQTGQPQTGQPQTGQPQTGQPQTGQPQTGQPQTGQPQTGQPQGLPLRDANDTAQPVGAGFTPARMNLNEYGQIAHEQWQKIPVRFETVELDAFVIMPNHIHGIIIINESQPVKAGLTPTLNRQFSQTQRCPKRKTIGDIVGAYKSLVANECLKIFKTKNENMGKLWQRNYYEHIIRDEKSYLKIAQYILDNPEKWELDSMYPGEKA